ncbi:hypothetical protein K435DRAFT_804831 [Dendrothele bispora CBS 962.96]|uniref:Uncharacterized protein n=1 Tax=Dendrothele bispora (strain CBS 962.96) TaxID=1314807 RepID=A0A4S8LEF3_DENBC|nr:hypothetical protein K435DRAFT_804831 [Dendrothele bispora CBS 962.96]
MFATVSSTGLPSQPNDIINILYSAVPLVSASSTFIARPGSSILKTTNTPSSARFSTCTHNSEHVGGPPYLLDPTFWSSTNQHSTTDAFRERAGEGEGEEGNMYYKKDSSETEEAAEGEGGGSGNSPNIYSQESQARSEFAEYHQMSYELDREGEVEGHQDEGEEEEEGVLAGFEFDVGGTAQEDEDLPLNLRSSFPTSPLSSDFGHSEEEQQAQAQPVQQEGEEEAADSDGYVTAEETYQPSSPLASTNPVRSISTSTSSSPHRINNRLPSASSYTSGEDPPSNPADQIQNRVFAEDSINTDLLHVV